MVMMVVMIVLHISNAVIVDMHIVPRSMIDRWMDELGYSKHSTHHHHHHHDYTNVKRFMHENYASGSMIDERLIYNTIVRN